MAATSSLLWTRASTLPVPSFFAAWEAPARGAPAADACPAEAAAALSSFRLWMEPTQSMATPAPQTPHATASGRPPAVSDAHSRALPTAMAATPPTIMGLDDLLLAVLL